MGSKTSKARKACVTEKSTEVNVNGFSGNMNVTKKIDTQCVSDKLAKLEK